MIEKIIHGMYNDENIPTDEELSEMKSKLLKELDNLL